MKLRLLTLAMCAFSFAQAQNSQANNEKEVAYLKVVTERAAKIVATLGIDDTAKFARVRTLIAFQYRDVNKVHEEWNAAKKAAELEADAQEKNAKLRHAELEANAALYVLKNDFIGSLSAEITPEQLDKVKDGMTNGYAPHNYRAFVDMIPSLTEEQKRWIWAAMCQAREYAMSAESSERKQQWFVKYRGRVNNYLAQQGYDLKKEREKWGKREAAN